jgi:hypothetical protein
MYKPILVYLCPFVGAIVVYICFLSGLGLSPDSCREFYVIYFRHSTIFDRNAM